MMLAKIEHGPGGADLRSFECLKCDHVQRVLVEDPLKSANTGWTAAGGLRSPNEQPAISSDAMLSSSPRRLGDLSVTSIEINRNNANVIHDARRDKRQSLSVLRRSENFSAQAYCYVIDGRTE